uniref:Cilia- and flagella-associated protein 73 isoform X3 n=1 Tax=Geotrypetes seraphini TaxID=260995 RepID=A0A6P8S976_GEOSA|nr:cilia- and flagella-associated protein 73 isoform X3 [Geotrypetes seraphini]
MAFSLEDYFRTALEGKLFVKMPEREDEYLTPATRLLEKRREMAEIEHALRAQKEEFQMKMESLQQRREELERKEEELKDSIFKFDKFLRFQEISEMVNRFNTLLATQAKLVKRESDSQETMEQERAQLHQYTEEMQNAILQLNNKLAGLKIKLEKAQSTTLQLEAKWAHILNTAVKKILLLGQIKMATFNIFQILTKQMRQQPDIPLNDPLGQLDQIHDCLIDLSAILTELEKNYPTANHPYKVEPVPAALLSKTDGCPRP